MNNDIKFKLALGLVISCRSSSPNSNCRGRNPLEAEGVGSQGGP
jgi:hypothetical protein